MKSETYRSPRSLSISLSHEVQIVFAVRIVHKPKKSQRRNYAS